MKNAEEDLQTFQQKHIVDRNNLMKLKEEYGFTKKKRCGIADTIDVKALSIKSVI